MSGYYKTLNRWERLLYWLAIAIILLGVVLRVIVWAQNRDLIIDEANIARNIFERGFIGLATPLSYEQYAPVSFLWMEKGMTMLFGFSEYALKAFPLLSGIGVLIVLMLVLKEFVSLRSLWYPLALFATAHFFLRYSTEVKQYMSDALVVLLLVYFALKISITETTGKKFVLSWILIGTLAICSAMPSVFALTGVGGYYFWICFKEKKYDKMRLLFLVSFIWLVEFALYYYFLLRDQAHSTYLQNFHADYFLVATPGSIKEWAHNWNVTSELVNLTTGYALSGKLFNFGLLAFGSILLLYRNTARGLLLILPLFFTLVAAAINEYSMIPRVVLFTMPLLLVVITNAMDFFMSKKSMIVKLAFAGMALACVIMHNQIQMAWKPFYGEQATWAMQLMKDNGIKGKQLNVSNGSVPAYIYYTQIHPDKQRWRTLYDAEIRAWDADWAKIAAEANGKAGVFFTTISDNEAVLREQQLSQSSRITAKIFQPKAKCYAFVFEK